MSPRTKSLSIIFAVFFAFSAPMLLAWYFFNHSDSSRLNTVNRGILVKPMPEITELKSNKWHLIYLTNNSCNASCLGQLDLMERIWLGLGKRRDQITPIFLTTHSDEINLENTAPDVKQQTLAETEFATLTQQLPDNAKPQQPGSFFIADSRGNIMMAYPQDIDGKSIIKDFKRLIKG